MMQMKMVCYACNKDCAYHKLCCGLSSLHVFFFSSKWLHIHPQQNTRKPNMQHRGFSVLETQFTLIKGPQDTSEAFVGQNLFSEVPQLLIFKPSECSLSEDSTPAFTFVTVSSVFFISERQRHSS